MSGKNVDAPAWAGGTGDTSVASFDPGAVRNRPNTSLGVVRNNPPAGGVDPNDAAPQQQPPMGDAPVDGGQQPMPAEEPIAPNDVRLQPGYAEWYYSQNPRDPRAPPPLTGLGRYGFQGSMPRGYTPPPGDRNAVPPQQQQQPTEEQTPPNQTTGSGKRKAKPSPMNPGSMAPVYGPSLSVIPSPGKPLFATDLLTPNLYGNVPGQSPPRGSAGATPDAAAMVAAQQQMNYQAAAAAAMANSPYAAAAAAQMHMAYGMQQMGGYGFVPPSPQQQWSAEDPAPEFMAGSNGTPPSDRAGSARRARGSGRRGSPEPAPAGGSPGDSGSPGGYAGGFPQSYAQQQEAMQRAYEAEAAAAAAAAAGGYDMSGHMAHGGPHDMSGGHRGGREPSAGGDGRRGRGGRGGRNARGGGGSRQPRSAFLTNFHNSHVAQQWTLENVVGHLLELARDQEGSRFIQKHLEDKRTNSAEVINHVFEEVLEDPMALMTDVFGNYVVQKMLDVADKEQLKRIATRFQGCVLDLTLHTFGCRVVQKAIQVFPPEGLRTVLGELRDHVAHCVQDQNGNHVIQKAIEQMPGETDFVVDAFLGRVPMFATHAYGCRVIQCIFTHSPNRQERVLQEIVTNTEMLSTDQFGNYVVQHVLQSEDEPQAVADIVKLLTPRFFTLSTDKFASNVMEKVYQRSTPAQRKATLDVLSAEPKGGGLSPMMQLVKDQFGNYVVQRMMDHSTDEERNMMVEHIKPHMAELRRVTFGKHIIARMEKASGGGGAGGSGSAKH